MELKTTARAVAQTLGRRAARLVQAATRQVAGDDAEDAPASAPRWAPSFATLERHPPDGWTFADPFPMPATIRTAFRALTRALCPPPPAPADEALYDRIEDSVRRAMRYMHPAFAVAMMGAFYALDWAPLWTASGLRRVRHLDRARASEAVTRAAHTEIGRQLVFAARMSILSMYFDDAEVQRAIGYEPTAFMRERIALRQRLLRGHAPTSSDLLGPHSPETAAARRALDQDMP